MYYELQKECNESSYKFVPTVPIVISTQSPDNTDTDHLADIRSQFDVIVYQTGKKAVKCTLWHFPQQVPSLDTFVWSLIFMKLGRMCCLCDFHCIK